MSRTPRPTRRPPLVGARLKAEPRRRPLQDSRLADAEARPTKAGNADRELSALDADAGDLTVVRCTDGSGWRFSALAGGREVGRIAYVGRGHDPGGGWLWAVKFGPSGYVRTYADALAALLRLRRR
jgi:hypothetical protein